MGDATSEAACSFLGPVYLGRSYCLAIGVGEHDCTRFGLRRQEREQANRHKEARRPRRPPGRSAQAARRTESNLSAIMPMSSRMTSLKFLTCSSTARRFRER